MIHQRPRSTSSRCWRSLVRRRAAGAVAGRGTVGAQGSRRGRHEFNDSHFHLTNYIQEGHRRPRVPADHGHTVGRVDAVRHPAAAAVVVRATPATSRRPTTCRPTRRSTTTRSPTPTSRCVYRVADAGGAGALRPDDHRLQPGRHVRAPITSAACCTTFPGVFTGIGEFTHPQGVRVVEDRRRDGQPHQPGARSHPRLRRRGRAGRDPAQRHRHAVRRSRTPSRSTWRR